MTRGAALVAVVLAACGRKETPASVPSSEQPSTAVMTTSPPTPAPPAADLGLGAAVVHVPPGLASGEKVPLVVILHGLGATSAAIERYSDFAGFAEAKRIAWVAPDGPKDTQGRQFWNAGATCCNFDRVAVDHVAALRALVERAVRTQPIDAKRVFFVGYSNGGFMAHRLACELDGLVAGIASVAGAGATAVEACPGKGPVRVLQVHGDADPIVPFAGGPLFGDERYPKAISAAQTASDWAKRFGCKPKPSDAGTVDVEAKLAGPETNVSRFDGCARGAVELWTVHAGGHYVALREPAYSAIWAFLSGT